MDGLPQQGGPITQDTTGLEVAAIEPLLYYGDPFAAPLALRCEVAAITFVEPVGRGTAVFRERAKDHLDAVFDVSFCLKQSALTGAFDPVQIGKGVGCIMFSLSRRWILGNEAELFNPGSDGG